MKNLKKRIISIFLILVMVLTMLPVNNGMDTAEAASAGTISFGENVTYGTSTLIQVKTDLPSDTPIANFTADQNECSIDQSGNTVQWVGWIGMAKGEDNCIYLSFNFNKAFTVGQAYVLPKGAVFGFADGKTYTLDGDYTFTFDGSSWTTNVENRVILPNELSFEYRYGANNLIQVNTNLPSTTPLANFTADQNGCNIDQSANQYQQVGWIQMDNVDGTIVLTFHFNNVFSAGQTYVLPAGAIFGFTDGSTYPLDKNYTFTFDGSSWSMAAETEPEEEIPEELTFEYRYGTNNMIQVNTNLPSSTPVANFLATDNGCNIDQSGNQYQQVGYFGMHNVDGIIVLQFNFNSTFNAEETFVLPQGAIFGFTDGNTYPLDKNYTFTFNGSSWSMTAETKPEELTFEYRYGANNLIQVNTNLPSSTPCANFLATDNGCNIDQSANQYQQLGYVEMANVDGVIVLTFRFNAAFELGQTYVLSKGGVFGFTDGNKYVLDKDYTFYYTGSNWAIIDGEITLSYRYGGNKLIQFNTDLPGDTPCANFLATDNGCTLIQGGAQQFGWAGMENVDGTIVITFHFNAEFTKNQFYALMKGSVFGFADGKKYALSEALTHVYNTTEWDASRWGYSDVEGDANGDNKVSSLDLICLKKVVATEEIANNQGDLDKNQKYSQVDTHYLRLIILYGSISNLDVLDPLLYKGGDDFVTFADIPVDSRYPEKIAEYKELGFNTGLLTEDYTGDVMTNMSKVVCETSNPVKVDNPLILEATGFTNGTLIQCKTNLPYATYDDFLPSQEGYEIYPESSRNLQYVQMYEDEGESIVYMNPVLPAGQIAGNKYILEQGSKFTFNGTEYTLDRTYTFTLTNDYLISLENLDKAGLDVWIRNYTNLPNYFTADRTAVLKNYKNVIDGFYMADEPFETADLLSKSGQTGTSDFASLSSTLVPWFNKNFPETYFHINHVPISSYDHYAGGSENASYYTNFLNNYADTFLKSLGTNAGKTICFDNYPFVQKQKDGFFGWGAQSGILENYLQNILVAANSVKNYNTNSTNGKTTFGMCIQTFHATKTTGNSSRDITKSEEISLQLYTGMAMGANMFEYFAYNSGSGYNGILDSSGNKRIYDLVKTANENAFCYADVLNVFDWQGVMTSAGSKNNDSSKAFEKVESMVLSDNDNGVLKNITSTDDAVAGYYTLGNKAGYMVANYNDPVAFNSNNTISLTFDGCTKARVYTAVDGKLTSKVVTLTNGSYTQEVAPGGAFFIIPV